MIVETCDRLHPLIRDEEMVLILGKQHLGEAEQFFIGRGISMLAEPVGRNTAPCIGLGAVYARYRELPWTRGLSAGGSFYRRPGSLSEKP